MAKLSAKQQRFVTEYLIDMNATQAAIRAGYSAKTAGAIGAENLKKPQISEAIENARRGVEQRTEVTLDRVINELAAIAFADPRDAVRWGKDVYQTESDDGTIIRSSGVELIDSDQISHQIALAISEVSNTRNGVAVKFHNKVQALTMLGKHLGLEDKKANEATDRFSNVFLQLLSSGSRAPIRRGGAE